MLAWASTSRRAPADSSFPRRRHAGVAAVLLAVLVGVRLASQTQAPPTFRSGIDVVQVDVSVLDRNRHPVRGLTAADFTVLEDGKPREIVAFTPVELPARATAVDDGAAAWTREIAPDVASNDLPREGRLVVIAFDWSVRFADQPAARRIALAAVDALGPGDLAAVTFTNPAATAGTPQNFTADRARLRDVIRRPIAAARLNPVVRTERDPRNVNGAMLDDPEGYESGSCYCRVCVFDAMTHIADLLRPMTSRRKVVLFISSYFHGVDPVLPTDRLTTLRDTVLVPKALGTCSAPLADARARLDRAASLAGVTVHVLDPVGLETSGNSPLGGFLNDSAAQGSSAMQRGAGLAMLADMTGGRVVTRTNTPDLFVPAILGESQSYYLLGFSAERTGPDTRVHRVEVKVAAPDVEVRSRRAFTWGDEAKSARDASAAAPLVEAIGGVAPRSDIPLSLSAAAFATPGKRTGTVALVLGARTARSDRFQIVAAALDSAARVVASREATVEITARANPAGDGRYELLSRLELAPGRYEIRVAAAAATGERGSVFADVDVPDFVRDPLNLSGVVLDVTPAIRVAPPDALADLLPVTPSARRAFAKTDRVIAFLRVYQGLAAARPVDVRTRIVDTAGRVVFTDTRTLAAAAFGATHAADYRIALPLATLQPGAHVLAIDATSPTHQARRNVRFIVQGF